MTMHFSAATAAKLALFGGSALLLAACAAPAAAPPPCDACAAAARAQATADQALQVAQHAEADAQAARTAASSMYNRSLHK